VREQLKVLIKVLSVFSPFGQAFITFAQLKLPTATVSRILHGIVMQHNKGKVSIVLWRSRRE
jgi:hypothetical protein